MESIETLARRGAAGDKDALEAFVAAIRDDVYGLAMRMLGHPADAEDATQEILVKIVTHLSSYRGDSSLRTWYWRIAANHVTSFRRSRKEPEGLSFETLEQMLDAGLAAPAAASPSPEQPLLEEEVKLGCTQAMLACLDRDHRLAFLLGDVLEMTGEEGAAVLEIEPAAFRKRLSRARERLREFMTRNCGLVSPRARCRCAKQVGPSMHMGMLDPAHLIYTAHPVRAGDDPSVWRTYQSIERAHEAVAVFRAHPDYAAPGAMVERCRAFVAKL